MVAEQTEYKTLWEFMPFYRSQHTNRTNRRLHFVGSTLGLILGLIGLFTFNLKLVFAGLVCGTEFETPNIFVSLTVGVGYAFAWVGHFFFEKNKPATFKYPKYSFYADWVVWFEILTMKKPF